MKSVCCDSISTSLKPHIERPFTFSSARKLSVLCEDLGETWDQRDLHMLSVLQRWSAEITFRELFWFTRVLHSLCLAVPKGPLILLLLGDFFPFYLSLSSVLSRLLSPFFCSSITILVLAAPSDTSLANTTVGLNCNIYIWQLYRIFKFSGVGPVLRTWKGKNIKLMRIEK